MYLSIYLFLHIIYNVKHKAQYVTSLDLQYFGVRYGSYFSFTFKNDLKYTIFIYHIYPFYEHRLIKRKNGFVFDTNLSLYQDIFFSG